ncbi:hypothetical protein ALO_04813 [Acetonema longum DSM 6540]|uniref:Uncharacterized protein n=1 Tax=Acetonema longum DSM 6540 TaxID=1009370 RepID=F7NFX9_9FIRM|nr:hypothetical protein ALO_04813 [Acetonema longum DSM 6540]
MIIQFWDDTGPDQARREATENVEQFLLSDKEAAYEVAAIEYELFRW